MRPSLRKYRETVDRLVGEGADMPEIERLVSHSRLPEEQGAALWLYAHALGCPRRPHKSDPPHRPYLVRSSKGKGKASWGQPPSEPPPESMSPTRTQTSLPSGRGGGRAHRLRRRG